MDTPQSVSAQEKLVAALGSVIFFLPLVMDVKTEFVVKYMKQGFGLNMIQILCSLLGVVLFFLGSLFGLITFICFCVSIYLAIQAYSGKSHTIWFLYEMTDRAIKILGIDKVFLPNQK